MVIEVTQEFLDLFAQAWHDEDDKTDGDNYVKGNRRRAGLEKVFAAIERDYKVEKK